jgi:chemotaxis protein methyltransferase CheR
MEKKNLEKIEICVPLRLENKDFKRLSEFIMSQYGIKMPPVKKTMLQCRLQKRVKNLDFKNFSEYIDYLFSPNGQQDELSNMIDAVSTNKTDFFREKIHFDFLYSQGIEEYLDKTGKRKLSLWSAGCSSGEEPYSIAIILNEFSQKKRPIDFKIIATDISSGILESAIIGIYNEEKTSMFSDEYRKKYLLRGKNTYQNKVRITSEIRNKVIFQKFNLVSSNYMTLDKFDMIFCRNVMIYFERDIQNRILQLLVQQLNIDGYLFLGHSESITGYSLPLKQIKPTIFIRI